MFDFSNKIDKVTDFTNKAETNQISENVRHFLRKKVLLIAICCSINHRLTVRKRIYDGHEPRVICARRNDENASVSFICFQFSANTSKEIPRRALTVIEAFTRIS